MPAAAKAVISSDGAHSGAMTLDHAALFERGADHAPQPVIEGFSGFQTAGQSMTSSRPRDHQLLRQEAVLFVIAEMPAAPFLGGGRHGGARQREDLHRRSGAAGWSARTPGCAGH